MFRKGYISGIFGLIVLLYCVISIEISGSLSVPITETEHGKLHEFGKGAYSSNDNSQDTSVNPKPLLYTFRKRRTTTPAPFFPPPFDTIQMPPGIGIYRPAIPYPTPPPPPGTGSDTGTGTGTTTTTTTSTSTNTGTGTGTMGRKKK